MIWYGMVWCSAVWYGMVWCGEVWYGMGQDAMGREGVRRDDMVCGGMGLWCGGAYAG